MLLNLNIPVKVGYRYTASEEQTKSFHPEIPAQYTKFRFDKAKFPNANGVNETGVFSIHVSNFVSTQAVRKCISWYEAQPSKEDIAALYTASNITEERSRLIRRNNVLSDCPCTLRQAIVDRRYRLEDRRKLRQIQGCHRPRRIRNLRKCLELQGKPTVCFQRRRYTPDSSFNFNYKIGTRCCYEPEAGELLTGSSGYDNLDSQNHFIPLTGDVRTLKKTIQRDIVGHRDCCLLSGLCNRYDDHTRIPTCASYVPGRRCKYYFVFYR